VEDGLDCVDYDFTPSPSPSPKSYRDALVLSPTQHSPPPATVSPAGGVGATGVGGATGGGGAPSGAAPPAVARKKRRRPSRRVRQRHPPPPVAVVPPAAARRKLSTVLAARLGPFPAREPVVGARRPRLDGFQEYLSQAARRRIRREEQPHSPPLLRQRPAQRRIPPELFGRCLNCLSYSHRVATCQLPRRCLRCFGRYHLARNCSLPWSPPPRREAAGASGAPQNTPHPQRFERSQGPSTPTASQTPCRTPSPDPRPSPSIL
jgi:hypothetical protein